MSKLSQKTIDQYLVGVKTSDRDREKILLAITHLVYQRNQNVIKAERETDDNKRVQFLRSIKEYDDIIKQKIAGVLNGKTVETYDF